MSTGFPLQVGDVCKICKVLATIAHSGTMANSTKGYRYMSDFCSDLGYLGDFYISEKIVSKCVK